jgi:hypothetical protein
MKDEYNTHSRYRDLRKVRNVGDKINRSKKAPSVEKNEINGNGQSKSKSETVMQRVI